MALISAQALHLRPLSLPPPPSYLSVQSQFSPLAPIKTPAHPVFSIHGPKPACQISRQRGGVVPKATVSDYSSTIGDILGEVTIFTASGEPVKFEDLWDQNEVKISFQNLCLWLVFVGIILITVWGLSFSWNAWKPRRPFWVSKAFCNLAVNLGWVTRLVLEWNVIFLGITSRLLCISGNCCCCSFAALWLPLLVISRF